MNDNLTCALVRDLLPSYAEGLTSEETNEALARHLASCPRCAAELEEMRRGAEASVQASEREVEYLKKVRRSGKKRVVLAVLVTVLLLVLGMAGKTFIVGEPASAAGMSWTAGQEGDGLSLRVFSTDSALALCRWRVVEEEEGVLRIHGRKVLVSPLYGSGEYRTRVNLSGVREVWLAERIVWQDGLVISPRSQRLLEEKTPYCGDAPALGDIARALQIQDTLGDYTMSLHTSSYPYGWTLEFTAPLRDWEQTEMRRNACVMLALVENLDEVRWTWRDGESGMTAGSGLMARDTACRELRELTESYNALHSAGWTALDDIRDYTRTPADMERLLILLEDMR